jgi:hypothetical protein
MAAQQLFVAEEVLEVWKFVTIFSVHQNPKESKGLL